MSALLNQPPIERDGETVTVVAPYNGSVHLLCTDVEAASRLERMLKETLVTASVFEE